MEDATKLTLIKAQLGIEDDSEDALLTAYLQMAAAEIISWRYSYVEGWDDGESDNQVTSVPTEYEMTQVFAVVAGYSIRGAEGQTSHSENGINRTFKHEDMVAYIRSHVIPIAGTF